MLFNVANRNMEKKLGKRLLWFCLNIKMKNILRKKFQLLNRSLVKI